MRCPDCGGAWVADHPAGLLVFLHSNECGIRGWEDSRRVADADLVAGIGWEPRDPTPTELQLLAALGVDPARVARVAVFQETAGAAIVSRTFLDDRGAPIIIAEEATQ